MKWSVLPASRRRAFVVFGVAALLMTSAGPLVSLPLQAQAPANDPLLFKSDAPVLIVNMVKADKVADFEAGWKAIRAAFDKSTRPEVKEFAATFSKMYRVDEKLVGPPNPPGSPVIFIFQIDNPSKTQSYSPVEIIYTLLWKKGLEGGISRPEADDLMKPLFPDPTKPDTSVYQNIIPWPLVKAG